MSTKYEIDENITVSKLAELLSIPASRLIGELFKNGVMATINEKIDFDTAQIVVSELGLDVELDKKAKAGPGVRKKTTPSDKAESRPPVVAVMGHVDHGKTSLLDAIRGASEVEGEAGGITQHISAYQVKHADRLITFLDTPGHEAFAALREHGANLTDVAIIVIAADEGIRPQTLEAVRFAKQAGVKLIIAASKMDNPGADLNKLKQALAENDLNPEDYGGQTIVMPVSAKDKTGIKELLDMVLLVADVEELKADVDQPARGLVIESHMETGRGPVAVGLVEQGTLKAGDFVAAGSTYAKVRNLENTTGEAIKEAGPSTPVRMTGFKSLPEFGDEFYAVADEREAKDKARQEGAERRDQGSSGSMNDTELLRIISRDREVSQFNVLIKADVQGSVTSVIDAIKTLETEEVEVRVVSSGVGVITENDIHLAASTGAVIYGFNVELPAAVKQLSQRDKVPIRMFKVIYELLDDVKKELGNLLSPEIIEQELGTLQVKGVFKITKTEVIAGGEVTKGKLGLPALARVKRGKELIADNLEVVALKKGPQPATEVVKGEMCGISFKSKSRVEVAEDDRIELFTRETRTRTL